MAFEYIRDGWFITVVFSVLFIQFCTAASLDCDFNLKVVPGQPIRLSNYDRKAYGLMTSCRWRIFSDTGVRLTCHNSNLPQKMQGCKFSFYVFTNGGLRSERYRYCGERNTFESSSNVMVVTLDGPSYISDGTFNCQFEAVSRCRCGWKNPKKIFGGEEVQINEYPMIAGIILNPAITRKKIEKEDLICGSTIISSQYVLTAAHCIIRRNPQNLAVLVGDHNIDTDFDTNAASLYNIGKTVIHEYFDETNNHNDIALVQIIGSIEYTNVIGPVCLPFNRHFTFEGQNVEIFGWGLESHGGPMTSALNKASVTVTNFSYCKSVNKQRTMVDSQICTYGYGKDACQMDSGGPILWKDPRNNGLFLVGIISYGEVCNSAKPSYNTRVSSFIGWIKQNTPDVTYCEVM